MNQPQNERPLLDATHPSTIANPTQSSNNGIIAPQTHTRYMNMLLIHKSKKSSEWNVDFIAGRNGGITNQFDRFDRQNRSVTIKKPDGKQQKR
jgi:hypothetical protein